MISKVQPPKTTRTIFWMILNHCNYIYLVIEKKNFSSLTFRWTTVILIRFILQQPHAALIFELLEVNYLAYEFFETNIFQDCCLAGFSASCYYLFIIMKFLHGFIFKAKQTRNLTYKGTNKQKQSKRRNETSTSTAREPGLVLERETANSLTRRSLSLEFKNTDKKDMTSNRQHWQLKPRYSMRNKKPRSSHREIQQPSFRQQLPFPPAFAVEYQVPVLRPWQPVCCLLKWLLPDKPITREHVWGYLSLENGLVFSKIHFVHAWQVLILEKLKYYKGW